MKVSNESCESKPLKNFQLSFINDKKKTFSNNSQYNRQPLIKKRKSGTYSVQITVFLVILVKDEFNFQEHDKHFVQLLFVLFRDEKQFVYIFTTQEQFIVTRDQTAEINIKKKTAIISISVNLFGWLILSKKSEQQICLFAMKKMMNTPVIY